MGAFNLDFGGKQMILRPEKYINVIKIPIVDVEMIDILMAKEPKQLMDSAFNSLVKKPTFMLNGGLFGMVNGVTLSTTMDEGKLLRKDVFSNFGFYTSKDGNFGFDDLENHFKDFLGGSPSLVVNGKIQLDTKGLDDGFLNGRHPRTAIGMNKEYLYLVVVDGRRLWAKGMTCKELAIFMLQLGCINAINLDGGGSTRLCKNVSGKLKPVNQPTENRAVDNFLCIYLKQNNKKTVIASKLNIRVSPKNGAVVGAYTKNEIVNVQEIKDGWARTDKGWVCEDYLV